MLTISADRRSNRREFLRVGGLSLGGLSLAGLLGARARAAQLGAPVNDKSVIFLFMHGGPTQTETFDPKMTAPSGVCSVTGEIETRLPGVTFGSTLTKLADQADRVAIVRSFQTGNGNHDIKPVVGRASAGANLGALYTRVAGTNHPRSGMPSNVVLFPRAVDDSTQAAKMNFGRFDATGPLGAAYAPFVPGSGSLQQDMTLRLPRGRLDDRRSLLSQLDRIKRSVDSAGSVEGADEYQRQAFATIVGGVADAFDLSHENPRTIEQYDTAPLLRPDQISRKWNNYNNYVDNAKSLGRLLLLARRLCEAGCGFVTVTTSFVWDMHADVNNATIQEGMEYMGRPFDHAVSAFLADVAARGLDEKILLVCTGEMGRTPKVNNRGGRDHWGRIAPLLLAGGGLNMGQVIGNSTRDVGEPASEPMTNQRLISTVMHTLLDVGRVRTMTGVPSDVARAITDSTPIPGLL